MLRLNVFKVDLVEKYGKLQFNLDYYTEVLDLDYILDCFPEDNFTKKYRALNQAMIGLITDYRWRSTHHCIHDESGQIWICTYRTYVCSLVNFIPVTVKSKERMVAVSQLVDKANG